MSTAKLTIEKDGGNILWVNNKPICFIDRIETIEKDGCFFRGLAFGTPFEIFGGIEAGTNKNQWFVKWENLGDRDMECTSLVECFKMIELA
tara:strand:- start:20030 stop:20302 length:273 start_codon:yes stop_codon:yes gene_type:complete